MRRCAAVSCAVSLAFVAAPAAAEDIEARPLLDVRLRYETVDQDGFARDAEALTMRARAGGQVTAGEFVVLAEIEATLPFVEHYDSGLNGEFARPTIADPANVELNRLQVRWRARPALAMTIGRQRIALDDQRFVGSAFWRQNEQTYDAARIEWGDAKRLRIDASYVWSVRTIWGVEGTGARPAAIDGDTFLITASHPTPIGAIGGFAYLIAQDSSAVSGFRQSSQTYGLRLNGALKPAPMVSVNYAISIARQSDYDRNPNEYAATYRFAELGLERGEWGIAAGAEILGRGNGSPFTSVQTPLARLQRVRGWADKFPVTPPDGLRDFYLRGSWVREKALGLDSIALMLIRRRFESDLDGGRYGDEWDAQAVFAKGPWAATLKLADYRADRYATDTRKLWVQLEWRY